jgi:ATP-dependent DNA ligase
MTLPIDTTFAAMEAKIVQALPASGPYQFEPKWDGFRAICFRDGGKVELQSKSGQPLARYFPEIVAAALRVPAKRFVIDGELVVPVDGRLDFDQLLQRIHPAASRVATLSETHPATYILFDLLVDERGSALHAEPLTLRRPALEAFFKEFLKHDPVFRLSAATADRAVAQSWFETVGGAIDGIIAKRTDLPYSSGDRHGMLKIKRMRSADCVVGGYRTTSDGTSIASLLLGLYDADGALDYIGFTSGFTSEEKRTMLGHLSEIATDVSFTGRSPGGPSRWNRGKDTAWTPVEPSVVLEVEFDHVSGGRFRHGTKPLRFRPDKKPRDCTMEQLQQPVAASAFTLAVAD